MVSLQDPVTNTSPPNAAAAPAVSAQTRGFGFRDLLSAMNPLQYLPVVGTLYRAVTGDVIPEQLRYLGSALVSGLLGGPIGLATNIVVTIAEKLADIDPEKIVAAQFNTAPATASAKAQPPPAAPAEIEPPLAAFSPDQLLAYGIRSEPSGTPELGEREDAEALNAMELLRLNKAAAAYAANQTMLLTAKAQRG